MNVKRGKVAIVILLTKNKYQLTNRRSFQSLQKYKKSNESEVKCGKTSKNG